MMQLQHNAKIEVYFIFTDNPHINKEWLEEDYVIQDNKLLVELVTPADTKNPRNFTEVNKQIITTDSARVSEKTKRFSRLLERAERFDPTIHLKNT